MTQIRQICEKRLIRASGSPNRGTKRQNAHRSTLSRMMPPLDSPKSSGARNAAKSATKKIKAKGSSVLSTAARVLSLIAAATARTVTAIAVQRPGDNKTKRSDVESTKGNVRRLIIMNGSTSKSRNIAKTEFSESQRHTGCNSSAEDVVTRYSTASPTLGRAPIVTSMSFLQRLSPPDHSTITKTLPAAMAKVTIWLR